MTVNRNDDYKHHVIIPHFIEEEENANEIINAIPEEKLLLLDKIAPGITGEYAAAYENFEKIFILQGVVLQISSQSTTLQK